MELRKIHCTNLVSISSLIYQCVVLLVNFLLIAADKESTVRYIWKNFEAMNVTLPSLLPILIVLTNHFTSLHSINRIFKVLWIDEESNNSDLLDDEVKN